MNEFLDEVKEMTEEDILLAFEQPELYSDEELEILRKEMKNRDSSTKGIKEMDDSQKSTKTADKQKTNSSESKKSE